MASNVIGGLSEIQKVVVKELDGGAGGGICKVVIHKIPTHDMLCSLRSCFLRLAVLLFDACFAIIQECLVEYTIYILVVTSCVVVGSIMILLINTIN